MLLLPSTTSQIVGVTGVVPALPFAQVPFGKPPLGAAGALEPAITSTGFCALLELLAAGAAPGFDIAGAAIIGFELLADETLLPALRPAASSALQPASNIATKLLVRLTRFHINKLICLGFVLIPCSAVVSPDHHSSVYHTGVLALGPRARFVERMRKQYVVSRSFHVESRP